MYMSSLYTYVLPFCNGHFFFVPSSSIILLQAFFLSTPSNGIGIFKAVPYTSVIKFFTSKSKKNVILFLNF